MEKDRAPEKAVCFTQAKVVQLEPTYVAVRDGVVLLYSWKYYGSRLNPALQRVPMSKEV
jgi:hypothetical protein